MTSPTIFLSAASDDLKPWRDVLHTAFERAGFKVFTQDHSLSVSTSGVIGLLKQHLDESQFVIHLAGMAYGSEPIHHRFRPFRSFAARILSSNTTTLTSKRST